MKAILLLALLGGFVRLAAADPVFVAAHRGGYANDRDDRVPGNSVPVGPLRPSGKKSTGGAFVVRAGQARPEISQQSRIADHDHASRNQASVARPEARSSTVVPGQTPWAERNSSVSQREV